MLRIWCHQSWKCENFCPRDNENKCSQERETETERERERKPSTCNEKK